jgi:pimeloyl-ACP methyl ester carboxylesterase
MASASLGDITVGYDDVGQGDTLVLVHGHPFDRSMWRPQVEHASGLGWRVIAPDLRGYGETSVVPGATTLDVFARDVVDLVDHLGIDRFVLGGLSMGGQIVMELVDLFSERVRGLLVADTSPRAETPEGKVERNRIADRLLDEGMADHADELLPRMVSPVTLADRPAVAEHVLVMMRGAPPEGAAAALRGRAERRDHDDTLAGLTIPTLIVVGSDDDYTPVEEARRMHDLLPGSSLVVVEGAGHLPNLECPDEFNTALEGLLRAAAVPGDEQVG